MNVYQNLRTRVQFHRPATWPAIQTIDMHTGGEPLRVILDGLPELHGRTVLECRREMIEKYDHWRKVLMFEPRGHADMYGCILLPPNDNDGDFGILFLHNEGYSTMCGHAVIAIATLALEMGWMPPKAGDNLLKIDAPCGRISAYAAYTNGRVSQVRFHGVPSFVLGLDLEIKVPGLGTVVYDLAYGGAFYAYVDLRKNNFDFVLLPDDYQALIRAGMAIKMAVITSEQPIVHPFEADLSFLYGTIFIGDPRLPENDSRNVCIFADGEVDRCPTGSGVSGRMAIHHARQELAIGQSMRIESIIDTVFTGSVLETVDFGPYTAVVPEVSGSAHITGQHTFYLDPNDPLSEGFILR